MISAENEEMRVRGSNFCFAVTPQSKSFILGVLGILAVYEKEGGTDYLGACGSTTCSLKSNLSAIKTVGWYS
jgi:hypothetical protein